MTNYRTATCWVLLCVILAACSRNKPSVPDHYTDSESIPRIYPDYQEVTIPANLAPINFMVDEADVDQCVALLSHAGGTLCVGEGRKVILPEADWQQILSTNKGKSISIELYTHQEESGLWHRHPAFNVEIADDVIDPWLSYRLIEPSYVAYEKLDIMERNLTSFEERTIVSNREVKQEKCINCHSYQNYHTQNMLLHVRGKGGGTLLVRNGQARLMTALRQGDMISNPVYPAWHPHLPLIAFSTNKTGQLFHIQSDAKVEVQDTRSELVLYDVDNDRMTIIASDSTEFENFPTWSPDGCKLFSTSAHYEQHDTTLHIDRDLANHYDELKYNLYVRDFDAGTKTFGERRLLLDMAGNGLSATLPRVSPDGRYLIYASGPYGCFHIWHKEADIRLLNLATMEVDSLNAVNSPLAESYPTWSSNGRWIVMASRRDDGNYSRVYISYFDRNGRPHKAFAVPQADPEHDRMLLRSYNRPETMLEPAQHYSIK